MQVVTDGTSTLAPDLDPTDPAVEGLRERKKAKTRRALVDAALDLFAKQGFERTTVEQIADACDVSPRTFFRYFATKEDVLFGDMPDKLRVFTAALEARPVDEPPLRSVRAAVLALITTYADDERAQRKLRNDIVAATPSLRAHGSERQDQWTSTAIDVLTRHRSGDPDATPPFEVRLAVAAAMGATRAATQAWLLDDHVDLETLVNQAFDRLASGLDA